jgi:branched-chain amino acid aminotransferase
MGQGSFGATFSDWMTIAHYRKGGWSEFEFTALTPLELHPAAHVLHYASTIFEGLKAYRHDDDSVHAFRVDRHVERMQQSAELLVLPVPESGQLQRMIHALVDRCRDDVPNYPGSLYLRPTLIGTQANIGSAAAASEEACLYVIASPVGDYFGADKALKLVMDDLHMRATADFGMAKTGGNYASALRHILRERTACGADQVLFCPGGDVQETGATNFFLLSDTEVVTKPLDGSFLHGVTRDSLLQIAGDAGYRVSERHLSVDDVLDWVSRGEAAVSGTAAVLSGVGTLVHRDVEHRVGDGSVGANTRRLRKLLGEVHRGHSEDRHGWLTRV